MLLPLTLSSALGMMLGMTYYVHARDCAAPTPDVCSCCGLPAYERESTFKRRGVTALERSMFCECAKPFFWVDYITQKDNQS